MSAAPTLSRLLLDRDDASKEALLTEIARRLEALGDLSEVDEDDPRTLLDFLLRMARHELDFAPAEAPAALRAPLEAHLSRRPAESVDHAQLFIDLDSSLRRAGIVASALGEGRACLAVGDDDALSLALLVRGVRARVVAVDIDEGLLEFLSREARAMGHALETRRVDVHEDEPPASFLDAFDVVVTDPPRSYDEAIAFLAFAARCLAPSPASRLFYADHPDWNPEHGDVIEALPGLGLELVAIHRSAHRYPLTASWVPELPRRAEALGVSADWLRALIQAVPAHSDLHELRPVTR